MIFIFVLMFVATTGMGAVVVTAQVAADRATRRATQACANG
jgi:hypothetical protein